MAGIKLKRSTPMSQIIQSKLHHEEMQKEKNKESLFESQLEKYKKDREVSDMYSNKNRIMNEAEQKQRYLRVLKKDLLIESFREIFSNACPSKYLNPIIFENMMHSYIKEKGLNTILKEFETKTCITSSIVSEINREFNFIKEASLTDAQRISRKDDFLNKIDKAIDMKSISDIIQNRVSDAIDNFIDETIEDKKKINSVLDKTKEKIDSANTENLAESARRLGSRNITSIKSGGSTSVLEMMINEFSKKAMSKDSRFESYLNENGRLDMDGIMSEAVSVYTFLEMTNTLKLDNISESRILEIKKEIKG